MASSSDLLVILLELLPGTLPTCIGEQGVCQEGCLAIYTSVGDRPDEILLHHIVWQTRGTAE